MKKFNLVSKYNAAGDQPMAIKSLVEGINDGDRHQTLLGVTGSGKTYSMAEIIKRTNKPKQSTANRITSEAGTETSHN